VTVRIHGLKAVVLRLFIV